MPGGDANDIRTPYPKGADSVVLLQSKTFSVAAGVDGRVDEFTLPFACKCIKAELTADEITDTDGDATVTVEDDTSGTSKKWVSASTFGATHAMNASVARSLTVVPNITFNAGALVRIGVVTTDAGDLITNGCVRLWVQPVF